MSDFKGRCTKLDFGWGSAPDLSRGAYSTPHTSWLDFMGGYLKGMERRGNWRGEKRIVPTHSLKC